jgi:hypothetical protein
MTSLAFLRTGKNAARENLGQLLYFSAKKRAFWANNGCF